MSSKLLEPVINNGLKYVNLNSNEKISASYCCGAYPGVATVQDLMKIIDEKCDYPLPIQPSKDCFIEDFAKGFESMWLSGKFSDFIIIAGQQSSEEVSSSQNCFGSRKLCVCGNVRR